DLKSRLARLTGLAQDAHDTLVGLDPEDAGTEAQVTAAAVRWTVDLASLSPADPAMDAPTTQERLSTVVAALADRLKAAPSMVPAGGGGSSPSDAFIGALKRAVRTVAGRSDLPVLPIVARSLLPRLRPNADLDAAWLEIVAAVRPRL